MELRIYYVKMLLGFVTLLGVIALVKGQQKQNTRYTLAVLILENVTPDTWMDRYTNFARCAANHSNSLAGQINLTVTMTRITRPNLSPRGVLDAFCRLDGTVSAVVLILPNGNSYKYLSIYKYVLNHLSSLGIPLIVWNGYMPRSSVFNTVVHIGPQYEHQAHAYMTLLKYYKWDKFSLLTTLHPGHVEFTSAVRRLVHEYTNEKGEQKMQILSSHQIRDSENFTDISDRLENLKKSDTRVILMHMSETEVVDVMKIATQFGMTTIEYMWLGTTQVKTSKAVLTEQLPLGMIALSYPAHDKSPDGRDIMPYTKAMLTAADFWKASVIKYHTTHSLTSDTGTNLGCNSVRAKQWTSGQALYKSMIGFESAAKDVGDCAEEMYTVTLPTDIDSDGLNRKTSLKFVNLAYEKKHSNDQGLYSRSKEWKMIGTWYAPNITELDDITWPGNSPKPPDGVPARSFLRVVTHEEPPYVKFTDPDPISGKCDTLGSVRVRLTAMKETDCEDDCRGNKTLFQCATGLCVDLLNKLKEDMQFDYEMMQARDNQWGNYIDDSKTEWNGIVRDLMDGVADISMTSLKIGPERNAAIDFSIPFIETGITIIVLIKKGVISATAFLEPYQYKVWFIVCTGMSFGLGILIFLFEWGSPKGLVSLNRRAAPKEPYDQETWGMILVVAVHSAGFFILLYDYLSPAARERYKSRSGERFSLARSLWLIWTILFGAAVETDSAKGLASRFLTAIWSLFSLVFLASYTANLAAFMITKEEFFALRGINDPKLRNPHSESPPFRFGTVPDGSTALNLKKNHPDMFAYMENYNKVLVRDGIKAVKNKESVFLLDSELQAFIYDATVLEYEASRDDDCKLTTVGSWYAMTGYGVGFPKGSKWKSKFDVHLTRYVNEGEMDRLRKFWLTGACKKSATGKGRQSSDPLDIVNFTSAYILLIVGVALAIILLLVEHIYFTFCRRKLRKIDRCGCCALISLSMGESLSFEESVMEVIESATRMTCHNDLCRANQQRLSHELDVAICRLNMLQATIQKTAHMQIPASPDLLAVTSGKETEELKIPPTKVWSKSARFEEEGAPDIRRRKEPPAVKSNEHLEAVESCL